MFLEKAREGNFKLPVAKELCLCTLQLIFQSNSIIIILLEMKICHEIAKKWYCSGCTQLIRTPWGPVILSVLFG